MSILAELAEDRDAKVAECALESMESYYASSTEMQDVLLAVVRGGDPMEQRRAAEQLVRIGIPEEVDISDLLVPGLTLAPLLKALNLGSRVPSRYRPLVLEVIQHPGEVREAAAQLLSRWPDDEDSRLCWRVLLWESSDRLQELALGAVQRSGLSLREWGVDEDDLRSLPVRVVANLLAAVPPGLIENKDLLPLLGRPEVEARLAAAIALRSSGPPLLEVEAVLELHLTDEDVRVAVECARTLVVLGGHQHRWALLRSGSSQDIELALQDGELPEKFGEMYVAGPLYSEGNSVLLRSYLGFERAAEVEVEALIQQRSMWASARLGKLGHYALDKMPELLGHFSPGVRLIARASLELLLQPCESYSEWLALHGLVLPLEHGPSVAEVERLQSIVCDYMVRAQLWSNLRLLPLWQIFSRSGDHQVACRAVEVLARVHLQSPGQKVLEALLAALHHPEEIVRRTALRRIGSQVTPAGWLPPEHTSVSLEAGLLILARRFAEGDAALEPPLLQEGLEKLIEWRLNDCQFFVPDRPDRLLVLFGLSGRSVGCDLAIRRLIWGYPGQTPGPLWKRIQELSLDPDQSQFHPHLAERWPQLVLFALREREDWLEWVLSLGSCAKAGLRQALKHQDAAIRLQGLAILGRVEQGFSDFFRVVLDLSQNDPDAEVNSAAQKLLDKQ